MASQDKKHKEAVGNSSNFCSEIRQGSYSRVRAHLLGIKDRGTVPRELGFSHGEDDRIFRLWDFEIVEKWDVGQMKLLMVGRSGGTWGSLGYVTESVRRVRVNWENVGRRRGGLCKFRKNRNPSRRTVEEVIVEKNLSIRGESSDIEVGCGDRGKL
ncbi:hypothetical protein L1887_32212 [Cichorium endivia]|nr:hypothetical protein L1887_32212 [Cichorium endivia]